MSKKLRVGLLFGGRSGEHEVSIASALSVFNALDKSRYEVSLIAIDKDGRWLLPDPKALLAQAADFRRQGLGELISRGYEDAYHQFIEPVVGASGDRVGV